MAPKKKNRKRTIFRHLMVPLLLLALTEVILWEGSMAAVGLFRQLDQNAMDILQQRVINRASYLQNEMIYNWSNIGGLAEYINETAENLETLGQVDFAVLDESSKNAVPLLQAVLDQMIATMRSTHVTGIYVIFSNEDLNEGLEDKSGIYIRDPDPLSKSSLENTDLLFERAPIEIVEGSNISTDSGWRTRFEFAKLNERYYDFFFTPYMEAYHRTEDYALSDMGYWGKSYMLNESGKEAMTYSVPLINHHGEVYGVLGVDITLNYLNKLLPSGELSPNRPASYLLAVRTDDSGKLDHVTSRGNAYIPETSFTITEELENGCMLLDGDQSLYAAVEYLSIYNSNTANSNQRWLLAGVMEKDDLFLFTTRIKSLLGLNAVIMTVLGIIISFVAGYLIARPIRHLSEQVKASEPGRALKLQRTNIREIDQLAGRMEILEQNIRSSAMKFNNILKMASVQMAGFEYNVHSDELFLSDNFFEILTDRKTDTHGMRLQEFCKKMEEYGKYLISGSRAEGDVLFKIPDGNDYVYVEMRLVEKNGIYTGVIENVTSSIAEKHIIEYERDHDALTGLLNRRAFMRRMQRLLDMGKEELKTSILIMMDLDNLKYVNDTHGHENGDQYIMKAAEVMQNNTPEGTVVSRISGDEFFIFLYGYEDEKSLEEKVEVLRRAFSDAWIRLSDNSNYPVSVSGGVAWYPRDSENLELLTQYAEYAMYKAKRSGKGSIGIFQKESFEEESHLKEGKKELNAILYEGAVQFVFQPIVDSHTGKVFGYESLMRSLTPALKNPLEILKAAKEEGRLRAVEVMTWFKTLETYSRNIKEQHLLPDARIFINSIPSQVLTNDEIHKLEELYGEYLQNIVMEVTEGEQVNELNHQTKEDYMKRWGGTIAIDDYGSGYNGDKVLLMIEPQYIKIDMDIIRNIDSSPDKCKLVEGILNFAHGKGVKVVAEGIETIGELKQVVRLGVDYLQGYLLAKPHQIPPKPTEDMERLIQALAYHNENEGDS